jgi:hypothetical protein
MMKGFAAKYWGIAVLVLSAFIWLKIHDKQVRDTALFNARRDSLNVAYTAIQQLNKANDDLVTKLNTKDSTIQVAKDSLVKQSAQLSTIRKRAIILTDSVVKVINVSDAERELLSSSIQNERNQFQAELQRLGKLNALSTEQLAIKDSIIGARDNQIAGLKKLNADLHRELNAKSTGSSLSTKVAFLAAGFVLGKI